MLQGTATAALVCQPVGQWNVPLPRGSSVGRAPVALRSPTVNVKDLIWK